MSKIIKKITGSALLLISCFVCVMVVNASSATSTLTYNNSVTVTKGSVGTSFTTSIRANSISKPVSIKTQAGRKMFNLVWYDSGTATTTVSSTGRTYSTGWSANGTYDTRATWTNQTSSSSINATFSLN
mgnify:CR=1 FL=1